MCLIVDGKPTFRGEDELCLPQTLTFLRAEFSHDLTMRNTVGNAHFIAVRIREFHTALALFLFGLIVERDVLTSPFWVICHSFLLPSGISEGSSFACPSHEIGEWVIAEVRRPKVNHLILPTKTERMDVVHL